MPVPLTCHHFADRQSKGPAQLFLNASSIMFCEALDSALPQIATGQAPDTAAAEAGKVGGSFSKGIGPFEGDGIDFSLFVLTGDCGKSAKHMQAFGWVCPKIQDRRVGWYCKCGFASESLS